MGPANETLLQGRLRIPGHVPCSRRDNNVLKGNTFASSASTGVVFDVAGTGNVLDGNVAALTGELGGTISVGIRFEQDGNFYGDNRMQANVPFDLGGTTQTDWGGNVGD